MATCAPAVSASSLPFASSFGDRGADVGAGGVAILSLSRFPPVSGTAAGVAGKVGLGATVSASSFGSSAASPVIQPRPTSSEDLGDAAAATVAPTVAAPAAAIATSLASIALYSRSTVSSISLTMVLACSDSEFTVEEISIDCALSITAFSWDVTSMEFRVEVMSRFPTPQSEPHPHPEDDWSPSLLMRTSERPSV